MFSSNATARSGPRTSSLKLQTITATALLVVILVAPATLLLSGFYSDPQLIRLSNIGQAYGAISAILSALAIVTVGASIAFQARQERAQRLDAVNRMRFDLLSLLISDIEAFGPCIIDPDEFESPEEMRQYFFTSMWLNTVRTTYELGDYTEDELRNEAIGDMTRSPLARRFWQKRRRYILDQLGALPAFHRLVDEEFLRTRPSTDHDR